MRIFLKMAKKLFDWFNAKWIQGKVHVTAVAAGCELGKEVRIGRHSYCENTTVGDYTYLSGFNIVVNARIGKFCSIGHNVSICPGKHPTGTFVSTSPVFYSLRKPTFSKEQCYQEAGSVTIGNDVWIGANAVILDDVRIGDGAIIAAGAIVTGDVPPYTIVGGVPAKYIRKRFPDEVIDKLLASAWWNRDEEWLRDNLPLMHDINKFVDLL